MAMNTIDTIEHRDYTIELWQDEYPADGPRDWDNLGHMICFHGRYNLGDKHDMSQDELRDVVKRKGVEALPLWLLDHSGLWMRTGSFAEDPGGWDSGMVGYIYVTPEEIRKEYGVKRITKEVRARARRVLEGEVKVYSQYLEGDCFGWSITDPEGEQVDSCGGYFGWYDNHEEVLKEAKGTVDYYADKRAAEIAEVHAEEIGYLVS